MFKEPFHEIPGPCTLAKKVAYPLHLTFMLIPFVWHSHKGVRGTPLCIKRHRGMFTRRAYVIFRAALSRGIGLRTLVALHRWILQASPSRARISMNSKHRFLLTETDSRWADKFTLVRSPQHLSPEPRTFKGFSKNSSPRGEVSEKCRYEWPNIVWKVPRS